MIFKLCKRTFDFDITCIGIYYIFRLRDTIFFKIDIGQFIMKFDWFSGTFKILIKIFNKDISRVWTILGHNFLRFDFTMGWDYTCANYWRIRVMVILNLLKVSEAIQWLEWFPGVSFSYVKISIMLIRTQFY